MSGEPTKQFIEMSDHPLIQDRDYRDGCLFVDDRKRRYILIMFDDDEREFRLYTLNNPRQIVQMAKMELSRDFIYLPSQEAIQDWLREFWGWSNIDVTGMLYRFDVWRVNKACFLSISATWLAFYMAEAHNMRWEWEGKQWRKIENE